MMNELCLSVWSVSHRKHVLSLSASSSRYTWKKAFSMLAQKAKQCSRKWRMIAQRSLRNSGPGFRQSFRLGTSGDCLQLQLYTIYSDECCSWFLPHRMVRNVVYYSLSLPFQWILASPVPQYIFNSPGVLASWSASDLVCLVHTV